MKAKIFTYISLIILLVTVSQKAWSSVTYQKATIDGFYCDIIYTVDGKLYDKNELYITADSRWSDHSPKKNSYTNKTITIPTTLTYAGKEYNVIGIMSHAFDSCVNVKSIVIKEGPSFIEGYAFEDCKNLTSIVLPNTLDSLGKGVFYRCDSLKSILLPPNINVLPSYIFSRCASLQQVNLEYIERIETSAFAYCGISHLNIPDNVIELDRYGEVFYGCSSLVHVRIPHDIKTISSRLFYGCGNLRSVVLPEGLTQINLSAFYGCNSLDTIYYKGSSAQWSNISISSYSGVSLSNCVMVYDYKEKGDIFEKDGIFYYITETGKSVSVTAKQEGTYEDTILIPTSVEYNGVTYGVTGITDSAFARATNLRMVLFTGSRITWKNLNKGNDNDILRTVPISYNYSGNTIDISTVVNYPYVDSLILIKDLSVPIPIKLMNSMPVTGIQMEVELPLGMTLSLKNGLYTTELSSSRTDATKHNIFSTNRLSNGRYLILCSSTSNHVFEGNDGTIFTLYVDMDSTIIEDTYPINIRAIAMTDTNSYVERISNLQFNVNVLVYDILLMDEAIQNAQLYLDSISSEYPSALTELQMTISEAMQLKNSLVITPSEISNAVMSLQIAIANTKREVERLSTVYRLTYFVDGLEYAYDSINYKGVVIMRDEPLREGYTFSGWDKAITTMPENNDTVNGFFTINTYRLVYLVDGVEYAYDSLEYNAEIILRAKPDSEGLYFDGWEHTITHMPAHNDTIKGYFTSCWPIENINIERLERNLIVLTWDSSQYGTETQWEVGVLENEESVQIVSENTAMIIGLSPQTPYTAFVKTICSEGERGVTSVLHFMTEMAEDSCKTVGTGTTSSYYSPIYSDYKNSWTQTIYPASEINNSGEIQSIAFQVASLETYRDLAGEVNIYLAHTDKNANASTSDWIALDALTLVYSTKAFEKPTETGWWSIPLQTPFMYNGTDNLALVVSAKLPNYGSNLKFYYTFTADACLYRGNSSQTSYGDHPASSTGTIGAYRANIQFCFKPDVCPNVTALTISDVTSTSATVTWEPLGAETSWKTILSTSEMSNPSFSEGTIVSSMKLNMTGLLVDQDYWFYIQPLCGDTDNWSVVNFRTTALCFPPTSLMVSDTTSTTATISWQDENNINNYTLIYGLSDLFNPADEATYQTITTTNSFYVITDLQSDSYYSIAVRSECDEMPSRYCVIDTFKTKIGIPFEPVFSSTILPNNWERFKGQIPQLVKDTISHAAFNNWILVAPDTVIETYHFKANVYGNSYNSWVVTPEISIPELANGECLMLNVDLGLTPVSQSIRNRNKRNDGVDDKFMIIVQDVTDYPIWMTDKAIIWSNDGIGDYVYNDIPEHGTTYHIKMSQFAGKSIRIAFYAESTVSNADNYLHLGNISLYFSPITNFEEQTCQNSPFDNHGFEEATSDSVGSFHFGKYNSNSNLYEELNLKVYPHVNTEISANVYIGDHYQDEYFDFYVQSGDEEAHVIDTLSSQGCDSIIRLILTISEPEIFSISDTIFENDTLIWRNQELTDSGVYYDTIFTLLGGVQEVYILTLIVTPSPIINGRTFELVTQQLADWTGNYLIVFADNRAHATISQTGNRNDLIATSDELTIINNRIFTADSCFVTMMPMGADGYSVLLPNGSYMSAPTRSINSIVGSVNPQALTLTYNEEREGVEISGRIHTLCCENNQYYRMYTSIGSNALPQLYKEIVNIDFGTTLDSIQNTTNSTIKVIINGSLFIIRNCQWYDSMGRPTHNPSQL